MLIRKRDFFVFRLFMSEVKSRVYYKGISSCALIYFYFFIFFYGSRQTHKAWRPLQGVGYSYFLFQRPLPLTPFTVHTDIGLGTINLMAKWYTVDRKSNCYSVVSNFSNLKSKLRLVQRNKHMGIWRCVWRFK